MRALTVRLVVGVGALLGMMSIAVAQAPLPKQIRIVVPFSPGGSNDVIARALAGPLAKRLDVAVIVENKAGAAGVIGGDFVAKAPHDGSVLLLTSSTFLTAAATQAPAYDPITAFAPVAMIGQGPMLFAVSMSTPFSRPRTCWLRHARSPAGSIWLGGCGLHRTGTNCSMTPQRCK